ncbi:MAG: PQQ-binding-like beta-propeller repeat protein [Verrucomicrobiaceae bacterium]|nr:PQQ-binding-like beta-propeller repeat protein [Verrucomicrobiaceae bacterium]
MKMFSALLALYLALAVLAIPVQANDWPSWRGPNGDGKLPDTIAYPTKWSATDNIAWRVDLPDRGNSSPVVAGDRLFLTQSESEGRLRSLICFDTQDGRTLWKKTIHYDKVEATHRTNPHCPASPVTDGKLVFAWHGNAGLFAYDLEGNEKWSRDLGSDYAHIWGPHAASPVLLGSGLILHAGPGPVAKLFALNKNTGKTIWQTDLDEFESTDAKQFKGSWVTPLVLDNAGRTEIPIGLPDYLTSFDPKTGNELWRSAGLGDLCYSNVIVGNGRALYFCGFGGPAMGIKLPGATETGDLTESHRLWADPPKGKNQNPQRIGSGQVIGDHVYLLNAPGVMQCSLVETGELLWRERLGNSSWSSMNEIGGTLYVNDTKGTTYLIEPDPTEMKVLAANPVDENQHTNASPAFANGRIYFRTDAYLYGMK